MSHNLRSLTRPSTGGLPISWIGPSLHAISLRDPLFMLYGRCRYSDDGLHTPEFRITNDPVAIPSS